MTMSEKHNHRWILVIAATVVLTFIFSVLYQGLSLTAVGSSLALTLIVGVGCFGAWVMYGLLKEKKEGVVISDERTLIVDGKAAKFTFIVSVYFIIALAYYDLVAQTFNLPSPKAYVYQVVTAMFLIFGFFFFRSYYRKKPTR
jgi:uncharacterized membrane protein